MKEFVDLGKTGFCVSPMCFGTLTMAPLQRNLPVNEGARLLRDAYDLGVNFFDTAEIYANYEYIRKADLPKDAVIATKSYSYDKKTASDSLDRYLRETGRERAEIYLLHEQESVHTLRGHAEAIEYFLKQKQLGKIGSFGISTHYVAGVNAAMLHEEIEVIHPLINLRGIGIVDGTREDMEAAIKKAGQAGKGIYAMKPLGGGHLIHEREAALKYLVSLEGVASVAIGIADKNELAYNTAFFSGDSITSEISEATLKKERSVVIQYWCEACGACVAACQNGALKKIDGRIVCDKEKCVFCGYCGAACKNAAIKVF